MKFHEYANIFPMMPDAELNGLIDDIKDNGLRDEITTYHGEILDGRNRYRACEAAGVSPRFAEYDGEDALGFVMSHNLHRRHLTESQRAMVGAKWAKLKKGGAGGYKSDSPIGGSVSETKTRDEASKILNVGTSSIDRAKKVIKDAPELVEKVEAGEMTVNAAYQSVKKATPPADPEPEPLIVDESRPAKRERLPKWIPDDAERLWVLAKTDLDKILPSDRSRERVLKQVVEYASNRLKKNI
jgi:hypothetical protein